MTLHQIQPRPADSPARQEGGGAQAPNPAVPIVPITTALAVPRHTLHGQGDPQEPLGPWSKQLIYKQGTAGSDKLRRKALPHAAWPSILTSCHLQRNFLDFPARRSPSCAFLLGTVLDFWTRHLASRKLPVIAGVPCFSWGWSQELWPGHLAGTKYIPVN